MNNIKNNIFSKTLCFVVKDVDYVISLIKVIKKKK